MASLDWRRSFALSATCALVGALAGVAALSIASRQDAGVVFDMSREPGPAVSGLYDVERAGRETFAWTGATASLALPYVDRHAVWRCSVRLRAGRPPGVARPDVVMLVDGGAVGDAESSDDYKDYSVIVPARAGAGLEMGLQIAPTFIPGHGDTRALGVMIDRWSCAPDGGSSAPPAARVTAGVAGAAFGAVLGALLVTIAGALAGTIAVASLQAIPLAHQAAAAGAYPVEARWLALVSAGVLAAGAVLAAAIRRRPLHAEARVAAAVSACAAYLKLLALLNPTKTPEDAVFHAHRLEWVLGGRLYFTQPMPSGVAFPYAIGLYVFAAPWAWLTHDHVLLLRVVVSAAEAAAGLVLYRLVSGAWQDRGAGLAAALLFPLVPRVFEIVGNANMTNAFGQSVALVAIAAVVLWPLDRHRWRRGAALAPLIAFALLCHVSTFSLLTLTCALLAVLYWTRGGVPLRRSALVVAVATGAAVAMAVLLYYGHFGAAYRSALAVRATSGPAVSAGAAAVAHSGIAARSTAALGLSLDAVGWPLVLLAALGVAAVWRRHLRDALGLAVAAWLLTWALATAAVVAAPVQQSFQRYAAEFITRVTLATYPAIVVLAGAGAAWAWRRGPIWRAAATALVAAAFYSAGVLWIRWLG